MILSVIFAVAVATSPIDDYFPMQPGTKWTYENESGDQMVQTAGEPIDIGKGVFASPITTTYAGRQAGTTLYRAESDTLKLMGSLGPSGKKDDLNLLKEPHPILRIGPSKMDWQYVDELPTGNGPVLYQVHGDSSHGPKRQVLGQEVETLVVHAVTRYGNERNFGVEVRQDMVYAKGIGLVETTEATKAQGQTVKKMLKLVKFEPPKG